MIYSGVFTALVTPFKNDKLDLKGLIKLAGIQVEAGVNGLVLTGTTGEAATLSDSEKVEIYKAVVAEFKGKIKIIAGTGSNNTDLAIKNSLIAEECGVDGLLVVTPYYNKPSQEGLLAHYKKIASLVSTEIIIYNVPGRTGVNITPATVEQLASEEKIVAVKEAGTFEQMNNMIAVNGKTLSILSGDDFTFMPFMALGGHGVISVVSNIVPGKMVELYNAIDECNLELARKIHFEIYPLIEVLFVESNPVPTKKMLEMMGLIEGGPRLPLVGASKESINKIQNIKKKLSL